MIGIDLRPTNVATAVLHEGQLDEPLVEPPERSDPARLIDQLACSGKAILMVSSYLPELLGTCDRIAVMCRGLLGPAKPVEQTDAHQIMLEATGT